MNRDISNHKSNGWKEEQGRATHNCFSVLNTHVMRFAPEFTGSQLRKRHTLNWARTKKERLDQSLAKYLLRSFETETHSCRERTFESRAMLLLKLPTGHQPYLEVAL